MITRRQFGLGLASMAFSGLAASSLGKKALALESIETVYGPLKADPKKLLDLPAGFSYKVISQLGDMMSDNFAVPDRADGMGCIPLANNRVALIRNHELQPKHLDRQPKSIQTHKTTKAYDQLNNGVALPGGTSTIIYNLQTQQKEQEFLSLVGTIRNCAGGITPWGTWLTCEESVVRSGSGVNEDHGYIFEVPANATGLIDPVPLKQMGRFNHEAAAVDPKTGIVYLTEDRGDSLFYRFVPDVYGQLAKGGRLEALVIKKHKQFDTRNWSKATMPVGQWFEAEWIKIENPESPEDDLRQQGYQKGAALFARGEGIHWGNGELYFCCTNGGEKQFGQIMRYQPSVVEGMAEEQQSPGLIQLFFESYDKSAYNFGDNLTVMPNGHLLVCEDQYTDIVDNHLRGVTPQGQVYDFARLHEQTELAGTCFSPDGRTLFVNVYSPAKTLVITGPW
ncbi:alkaline phosphatase PhoX [Catenovulum agarivorans]|uniref:alkaline phosphatase PhoX n=1 Tax=Catenovulum agarivorans TaxID=1172192 RepID=UPI0002F7E03F|nr:alkaline phosphatase PhoX [Catenovulum agarivorans]